MERRLGPGRGIGLHITEAGAAAREGNALEGEWLGNDDYAQLRTLLQRVRNQLKPQIAEFQLTRSTPR